MAAGAARQTSLRPEIASTARLASRSALPVPSVSTCGLCFSCRSPLPPAFPAIRCPEFGQHEITEILRRFAPMRFARLSALRRQPTPEEPRNFWKGEPRAYVQIVVFSLLDGKIIFPAVSLRLTLHRAWVSGR